MSTLASTLQEVRQRIQRAGKKSLNEENIKATLIEPVLRALGWDVEDLERFDEIPGEATLVLRETRIVAGIRSGE